MKRIEIQSLLDLGAEEAYYEARECECEVNGKFLSYELTVSRVSDIDPQYLFNVFVEESELVEAITEIKVKFEKLTKIEKIFAIMEKYSTDMSTYSYHGSNYGVPADSLDLVAKEIYEAIENGSIN
jgi:hypothetical protein